MFQTSNNMQLNLPANIDSQGLQQWHTFSQILHARWFHVRYSCKGSRREQILMTGDLDVVENINGDPTLNLINVSLASPPQLNGTSDWLLSSLNRVVTLVKTMNDMELVLGYEYILDSGLSMIETFGSEHSLNCPNVQRSEMVLGCDPAMPC